ncbi:MAG: hypothetical protein ACI86M_000264 [Saprospiraceae bacterium]|jgi:hypothetical protein
MIKIISAILVLGIVSICSTNLLISQDSCESVLLKTIHNDFEDRFHRFDIDNDFSVIDSVFRSIPRGLDECDIYFRIKILYANLIDLRYRTEDALSVFTELLIDPRFKNKKELQTELSLNISPIYSNLNRFEKANKYLELADSMIAKTILNT